MGSLWSYQIKCSLVSTDSVKPLLHTHTDYANKFFFVEVLNGILLNCHICQFFIAVIFFIKHFNLEEGVYLWAISAWGVSETYNLIVKGIKYLLTWRERPSKLSFQCLEFIFSLVNFAMRTRWVVYAFFFPIILSLIFW